MQTTVDHTTQLAPCGTQFWRHTDPPCQARRALQNSPAASESRASRDTAKLLGVVQDQQTRTQLGLSKSQLRRTSTQWRRRRCSCAKGYSCRSRVQLVSCPLGNLSYPAGDEMFLKHAGRRFGKAMANARRFQRFKRRTDSSRSGFPTHRSNFTAAPNSCRSGKSSSSTLTNIHLFLSGPLSSLC